jgi:hypothetical protein
MIKLIRMRSGEDVVGEVTKENEEFIDIKDPATLMPMSGGANNAVQMGMVPWQPFSKSKEFSVPRSWVVTVSEPADDLEDNYRRVYGSGIGVPPKKLLLS